MTFKNPLFGASGAIAVSSIHSLLYQLGVSGWSLNKDGTAEFNSLGGTFQITGSGIFFYIPNAGSGNLRMALTNADGTDPYGNAYKAGLFVNQRQGWFTGNNSHTLVINATGQIGPQLLFLPNGALSFMEIVGDLANNRLLIEQTGGSSTILEVNAPMKVDSILTGPQIAGKVPISFTTQTSFVQTVTFPTAFVTPPVVMTNIADGTGAVAHWDSRAIAITNSTFQIFVYAATGAAAQTWSNIPVQWIAIGT